LTPPQTLGESAEQVEEKGAKNSTMKETYSGRAKTQEGGKNGQTRGRFKWGKSGKRNWKVAAGDATARGEWRVAELGGGGGEEENENGERCDRGGARGEPV